MRDISMERVNETRKNILEIIESATLTHEQKLTCLANQADSLMEVLDLPEGLDELLNVPIDRKCICDLSEGHAPMRPRYIIPDYAKFLKEGSKFLQLDPPTDLYEALNSLMRCGDRLYSFIQLAAVLVVPLHIQCVQSMSFCGDLIEVVADPVELPHHGVIIGRRCVLRFKAVYQVPKIRFTGKPAFLDLLLKRLGFLFIQPELNVNIAFSHRLSLSNSF